MTRTLAQILTTGLVLALLSACGPRESGYVPAANGLEATPGTVIDLYPDAPYHLQEGEGSSAELRASADTGDSNGMQRLIDPLSEASADELGVAVEGEHQVGPSELSATRTDELNREQPLDTSATVESDMEPAVEVDVEADVEPVTEPVTTDETSIEATTATTTEPTDEAAGAAENMVAVEQEPAETSVEVTEEPAATDEAVTDQAQARADTQPLEGEAAPTAEGTQSEPLAQTETGDASDSETGDETDSEATAEAASFDWQQLGEETYSANCAACHQATGQGVPGAFPPLAGHLPELYDAEGGRSYMIHVVLYGLQGEILVDGTTYNGVMPAFGQLSDEQIAATLNHELSSWGNDALIADFKPITPDEVAAEREAGLTAAQVYEGRPDLGE